MMSITLFSPPIPQTPGDQATWGNLHGSTLGLAISIAAQQTNNLVVVITPDSLTASRLKHEITFFTNHSAEIPILIFPDWETLPYDSFSPHQDIISQRLFALYKIPSLQKGVLIVPITTLMQRLAQRSYLEANSLMVKRNECCDRETLRLRLERGGYRCVGQVMEHGEFAVRGSLLDLYPMGSALPYRIDFLGNEIDSIRTFDPDTQRSIETIDKISLLPAREFPMTDEAITRFRQNWRDRFSGNPANCPIYQDVSQGASPAGIEYYLPLFFEQTQTLFNYLPDTTLLFVVGDLVSAAEVFWSEIKERYEQRCHDITRPILEPLQVFLPVNDLFAAISRFARIKLQTEHTETASNKYNFATIPPPDLLLNNKSERPLAALETFLRETNSRVLLCAETAGRREILSDLLKNNPIVPNICASWSEFLSSNSTLNITIAPLEQGLCLVEPALTLIAEPQLFGQQVMQRRYRGARTQDPNAIIRNLAELHIGAPVVHIDQGVGRYLGLQTLKVGEIEAEYLTLEYAGNDKLYVPVSSLHFISRYSGVDPDHAPLHRLGTDQWAKAKRKAAEQIRDVAAELLDIYARRAARKGHAFAHPDNQYHAFAAAFPFETTPDQQQAIEQVIQDMISDKPMDRLICGDVGFGKTEVAMRAAFIAVQENKQVAVLVPTTLLATQHYENFKDRFADWPINIAVISRFQSKKEQIEILQKLKNNKVDILIGTHKLLQEDIHFSQLGLMIIDEEHRFGVQQKDRLKALRSEVDILTLTATPIPRTLNLSLSGIRELSIIATPPSRRLSIKTFVRDFDKDLIREAIMREILRGGQVYFLHNDVATIQKTADELVKLIPESRVGIAHGQMRERELEHAMADFYHHRFNVLVCTTIIESGIDIPTANTILINRADKFGLAQLHQLRGRVGRSHHQAYAYLLIPSQRSITADAEKRLDAISSLEDLGAGFTLATHDLEIRGAGELLGEQQSGNMQAVGFSLYMELLERAVNSLKSGKTFSLEEPLRHGAEVDLQCSALIPETYVPDIHARLMLYKRIANATDQRTLDDLQVELIDCFGLLPEHVKNLFRITELKLQANALGMGIRKIEAGPQNGRLEFETEPNIDPAKIIQLIQKQPQRYRLEGPQRLRFTFPQEMTVITQRVEAISALLKQLAEKSICPGGTAG